jgi:uncharacterized membrane protein YphA (DoxX/SURF4 family)
MELALKNRAVLVAAAGHVIAVCVALLLGSAGVLKLYGYPPFVNSYIQAGQPYWVLYGSGLVECLCSVGLLIPRMRLYAAWGFLAMIFLVAWRPWSVHQKSFLLPQCLAITMLIVLVWPLRQLPRSKS